MQFQFSKYNCFAQTWRLWLPGAYHDHSGSYSGVFCMAGAAFLLSGILLILLDRVCRVTQTDSISFSDDTGSSDTDDLSNRNYLSLKH